MKKQQKKNKRQEVTDRIKEKMRKKDKVCPCPPPSSPWGTYPHCIHCWHPHCGPIWMVIPPGHILEQCCKCGTTRTVHYGHCSHPYPHGPVWMMVQ